MPHAPISIAHLIPEDDGAHPGKPPRGGQAWWHWYNRYLASRAWTARRARVLDRDRHACRCCGAEATQVHHLTYVHVGYEPLTDLIALCEPCHAQRHRGRVVRGAA